jgi:ABC-type transporter Mla subunit MlaD
MDRKIGYIVGTLILVLLVVSLTYRHYNRKPLTFHLLFEEKPPIEIGTPLKMKDVEKGKVSNISLKNEYVDVEVLVDYKNKKNLRKDCEFTVRKESFLGRERFIEVVPSKNESSPLIKNGEQIHIIEKESIFNKMKKEIKQDIQKFKGKNQTTHPAP